MFTQNGLDDLMDQVGAGKFSLRKKVRDLLCQIGSAGRDLAGEGNVPARLFDQTQRNRRSLSRGTLIRLGYGLRSSAGNSTRVM